MIENLKIKREALGLSREELANQAGVPYSAISTIERGATPRGGDATLKLVEIALNLATGKRINGGDEDDDEKKRVTIYTPRDQHPRAKKIPKCEGFTFVPQMQGILPGDLCLIEGEEGSFRFIEMTTSPSGAVSVSVFGGRAGFEKLRSFRPERLVKV